MGAIGQTKRAAVRGAIYGQRRSAARERAVALWRYAGAGQMVSSWLKDTCPAEAMEILSERVQIARCQARVLLLPVCGRGGAAAAVF